MLTIDPVVAPGGRRIEGNSMRWARSPSRIYRLHVIILFSRSYRGSYSHASICNATSAYNIWGVELAIYAPSLPTVKVKLSDVGIFGGDVVVVGESPCAPRLTVLFQFGS